MNATALDWHGLIAEAIRRRKEEGLTQRDLAALSGVSPPTVIAFEKGLTSIRLENALNILETLGLTVPFSPEREQDLFVARARERWLSLVSPLKQDESARQPFGSVIFDYSIEGSPVRRQTPDDFLKTLGNAVLRTSGWPPFWVPIRQSLRPSVIDGVIECWLGKPDVDHAFDDPSLADFWRASPQGRLYLQKGYQEDRPENIKPGSFIDLTLPMLRSAELLLHARSLALLFVDTNIEAATIVARARYTGLKGRELISWANPLRQFPNIGQNRARVDEVTTRVEAPVVTIRENLPDLIYEWLTPLYKSFDYQTPNRAILQQEIERFLEKKRNL